MPRPGLASARAAGRRAGRAGRGRSRPVAPVAPDAPDAPDAGKPLAPVVVGADRSRPAFELPAAVDAIDARTAGAARAYCRESIAYWTMR